jgi:hypothetical protein
MTTDFKTHSNLAIKEAIRDAKAKEKAATKQARKLMKEAKKADKKKKLEKNKLKLEALAMKNQTTSAVLDGKAALKDAIKQKLNSIKE